MNTKQNFFDHLDGGWSEIIADMYNKNSTTKLLDSKELYITYNCIDETIENYVVNVEYDLNTIDIFLDLNIKSDSDNIKINYYDEESFMKSIKEQNYDNLQYDDVISYLQINIWRNYKGKYNCNLKYIPFNLTGLYKGQVKSNILNYGSIYKNNDEYLIDRFDRQKDYYINPILLYKQIDRFIVKDLNNYIKSEDVDNVVNILEKVKFDIEKKFKEKNLNYQ